MSDHIVFDVEIQKTIEELPHGWDSTDLMGVACCCLWEFGTRRMRVYGPDDVAALKVRLHSADRISGFNILNFDLPVIWGQSKDDWKSNRWPEVVALKDRLTPKTDDLLRRIWQALGLNPDEFTDSHKGWGLDAVAKGTLGAGKIGYGGDAPKWYQDGQHARVINYCCDDVALERDLTEFVDRYGYVVNGNTGRKLVVPPWQPGA